MAIVAVLLLALGYALFFGPLSKRKKGKLKRGQKGRSFRSCPLCGIELRAGENVKSAVFPGGFGRMTHIFGCPFCYPANAEHRRRCPACRKEIAPEGYVIARLFEKPGSKHVHVLGCTGCRKM